MSNIHKAFAGGKAFIPFITCGDPALEITEQIIYEAVENGADLIELGIPFSDPVAEGETIQAANARALKNGVNTDKIFGMVQRVREKTSIPLVFMTYANVIYSYGIEKFAEKSGKLNMDGVILPDVPFEEKVEFESVFEKKDMDVISLIAPTSKERIKNIAAEAKGFIYCVSSLGVTGERAAITTDIGEMVNLVRKVSDIPAAVGFGISSPEQARKMSEYADGVIVGSAIVRMCADFTSDTTKRIGEFVKSMKNAIS